MHNIKLLLIRAYIRLVRLFRGVKRNKAVFVSFNGKSYSDNPRFVSEALHALAPDTEIVWLFVDPEAKRGIVPDYVRCVSDANGWQAYTELATAAVLLSNFGLYKLPKSKKQFFIQTWHGDKAFKKVLYDSDFVTTELHVTEAEPGYCDLAVAGSEYGKRQYESAFRYKGKILMEGTPRNDQLVSGDPARAERLRRTLEISADTKVLLYAPTLRREQATSREAQPIKALDLKATLDTLEARDGCRWICLLRAHPSVVGLAGAGGDARIRDVSTFEDMSDLMTVGDMLITDYSSCAGDFALLGRELVLFQADRQEYLEKDRTFYFDISDSPYLVAEDQQELEAIIAGLTPEKAAENCRQILEFYGDCETGHAAQSVAKIILDWMNNR